MTRFSFFLGLSQVGDLQMLSTSALGWLGKGVICWVGVSSSIWAPFATDRLEPGVPVEGKRELEE